MILLKNLARHRSENN